MPLKEIINFSQSSPGWDLIKALYSYYKIKDYLIFRYYETFKKEEITDIYAYKKDSKISGDQVFWQSVLSGQLLKEDRVRLFNFQVSPWFPRKPGTYWTYDAALAREEALSHHVERLEDGLVVFDIWGKTLMSELGGIGSLNIRKDRSIILFTLTASGYTDRGIPIICSQRIWKEVEKAIKEYQFVEIDVKGTVQSLPLNYDSYFLRSAGLPKIAVSIESILNLKIKTSDLRIIVSPWTIFETESRKRPYGFTYVTHNLASNDYKKTVKWIQDYVEQHQGKVILTDFDEETNCLNARFPLNGCLDGSVLTEDIIKYCQEIARKFKKKIF
jgi:hypothetical protein